MRRLIPAAFVVIAAALICFVIVKKFITQAETSVYARVVVPQADALKDDADNAGGYGENYSFTSFIQLSNDETLMSAVTMDVDNDGSDDQVNICKVANNPYIVLIIALYNTKKNIYERKAYIPTNVTQMQTFLCTNIDVLGNHHKALVYQGDTENGHAVMRIYMGSRNKKDEFKLTLIGDFDSDERVFIEQSERNEAYEISQAKGAAFPVWVYSSAPEENRRLDQIQTMYEYSEEEGKYVETRTIRVAGSRITAKELTRIQDGTVATFANFLDGLWYKTENEGAVRYIFFDYKNKEVIFQFSDSVEVYSWLKTNLRRNGMYFSSVNKTIENLQRRFDISLVNIDEIRIRIQDDLRMVIGESNLWDGNYKKFTADKTSRKETSKSEIISELIKGPVWSTSDGTYVTFTQDNFHVEGNSIRDDGRFVSQEMSGSQILEFRSSGTEPYFKGFYEPKYHKTETTKTVKGKTVVQTEIDKNTIILQNVIANADGFYQTETSPVILYRSEIKKTVKD